jgi:hypothetical protein
MDPEWFRPDQAEARTIVRQPAPSRVRNIRTATALVRCASTIALATTIAPCHAKKCAEGVHPNPTITPIVIKAHAPAIIGPITPVPATTDVVVRTLHRTATEASTTARLVEEENSTPTEAKTKSIVSANQLI